MSRQNEIARRQDGVAPRTAADLERRYGKNFSEILGIATDARDYATEAKNKTEEIELKVGKGLSAQFSLSIEEDDTKTFSLIDGSATKIHFKSDSLLIESTYFRLQEDGTVKIRKGDIGGCSFDGEGNLIVPVEFLSRKLLAEEINADGIVATNVDLTGTITATGGSFGNAHITSEGSAFGKRYDGFYLGENDNDTFFGINDNLSDSYRAFLALGLNANEGVLITNKDIQIGGTGTAEAKYMSWLDIYKAVEAYKDSQA